MPDAADLPPVTLFTDGACLGNPGPGGWAALLLGAGTERLLADGEPLTTNNRMELMAAIQGLRALKRRCRVELITDSRYVMQGIEQWLPRWRAKGWRTAAGKPVKNRDLWEQLSALTDAHQVRWRWVKGHAGCPGNERVDSAARAAATQQQALSEGATES